jgi:hypothetical protein
MPKAGRYEYPGRDLDDCTNHLKQAYDIIKEHSAKREQFADTIKMSPKGGNFGLLVGAMAICGLVHTGDSYICYTDLTKNILHGTPAEVSEAKSRAVRNVTLFADIYGKYGANPSEDQLRDFLRSKALVDISEANSLSVEVGKIFKRVVGYLTLTNMTQNESINPIDQSENQKKEYKLAEGIEIRLPELPLDKLIEAWKRSKIAMDVLLGTEIKQS